MDVSAGAFFQRTFYRIFSLPRIVSGLLSRSKAPLCLSLEDGLGEGPFIRDPRIYSEQPSRPPPQKLENDRILIAPATQINSIEADTKPKHEHLDDSDIPYADEPIRVVLHDDGPKDYLSMLLTEDMVSKICSAGKDRRALEQVERLAQDADLELTVAEIQVGTFQLVLKQAQNEDEVRKFEKEQKERQKELGIARQRQEVIGKELDTLKLNEKRSRSQLQDMLEHILEQAGLVDLLSLEPQVFDEKALSECSSSVSVKSESTAPSCGELLRRTVDEDLTNAKWAYTEAERNFDNRHYFYQQELQQYKEYAAGREAFVTRTEFDGHLFVEINQLTRNLIEAEDRLNAARAHAKAFGLPDQWEKMLNGIIDPGTDRYKDSEEAVEIVGVDRDRIGKWWQGVSASQELPDFDSCEDVKLEQWDAESVGASDSCSVVDWMGYGPKIVEWQEFCRLLREERIEEIQVGI